MTTEVIRPVVPSHVDRATIFRPKNLLPGLDEKKDLHSHYYQSGDRSMKLDVSTAKTASSSSHASMDSQDNESSNMSAGVGMFKLHEDDRLPEAGFQKRTRFHRQFLRQVWQGVRQGVQRMRNPKTQMDAPSVPEGYEDFNEDSHAASAEAAATPTTPTTPVMVRERVKAINEKLVYWFGLIKHRVLSIVKGPTFSNRQSDTPVGPPPPAAVGSEKEQEIVDFVSMDVVDDDDGQPRSIE